jgi:hypothetical protein
MWQELGCRAWLKIPYVIAGENFNNAKVKHGVTIIIVIVIIMIKHFTINIACMTAVECGDHRQFIAYHIANHDRL